MAIFIIASLFIAALLQDRGLQVDARRDGVGVKLDQSKQPAPSTATYNDGSPIVTAPDAKVEVKVTGPTKSTPAQTPTNNGISTFGAASPIVTGQGAVVKSIVDNQQ